MKWQWSEDELHTHWFLSLAERDLFSRKTKHGRLGFAILLKFFQSQGHFPEHRHAVPDAVVCYLANQIDVAVESLDRYDWAGRTGKRDRTEVLAFLGIRRHDQKDKDELAVWLQTEILPDDPSLEHLWELARDWFSVRRIEPPGSSRLERFLHTTAHNFETGLFLRIATRLSPQAKASIDALLDIKDDATVENPAERCGIPWLSTDPRGVSLDCALQELAKLDRIRQLDLPVDAFAALPTKWLQKYCRRAGSESTWELRRHPKDIRYSLVAAFCWQRQQVITDGLVDLFIQVVHKIGTRAENKVEKQLLEDLRQVRGKTNVLFKLAEAAVGQPEGVIKDVLYPVVCIYSQLKRCSSSEVASMIEGVLRHETDANVQKQYTDSHGQSEVGFAFCYLLGFDLLPRLKAIASQKLYLPEVGSASEYTNLASILTNPIKWELIRQQYDEMVKYATALRLGTADAEAILRRFTRGNLQHPTYKALAELGKAMKTVFLCRYLHSEALRREIHERLNVVENWNSANGFIFYGQSGEITSNRMEDQELSVLSLHLLQLCLVYVNTLMIQQVLAETQWKKRMNGVDLRALSPLIYAHVNPYGRFELDMSVRLPINSEAALLAA